MTIEMGSLLNFSPFRAKPPVLFLAAIVLSVLMSGSCSWQGNFVHWVRGDKIEIKVKIAEKANQNSSVGFDLLIFTDKELLNKVLGYTSKEWFKEREQFKQDYLSGGVFYYHGWEFVPGQEVEDLEVPGYWRAAGAIVFVNYQTPGPHRYRVNPYKDFSIEFLESKVIVKQPK